MSATLFKHYPVRVRFQKLNVKGAHKGITFGEETLHFASEQSASLWVAGVRKNCRDWKFAAEPVTEANPFFSA